tara:strand:+ start:430 stop:1119 length:690 start_codon:yes stop_codon:yes gene_type:complete
MRGGSKEIVNKNIRNIGGKPLMSYSISQAIKSKLFDLVMVSTDSKKIFKCAKKYGATGWFLRPKKLATDDSVKLLAIRHALVESEKFTNSKFDVVFNLHVTAPLRNINDIKKAYRQFLREKSNKLISVTPCKRNPYFNMVEKVNNKVQIVKKAKKKIGRRQDAPIVYDMNASIYIWRREELLNLKSKYDNKTSLYIMPAERSIDIDSTFDWKLVENILKKRNEKKKLFK